MKTLIIGTAVSAVLVCGCVGNQAQKANEPVAQEAAAVEQPQMNQLTAQEQADGWQLLFARKTSQGWRGAHMPQ